MNVIRCKNGHFFDGDSYDKCPHCGESAMTAAGAAYTAHEEPKKSIFGRKKNKETISPPVPPATPVAPISNTNMRQPSVHGGMYDNGDSPTDVIENRASSDVLERKPTPGGGHTVDFWSRPSTSDSRPITGSSSVIRESREEAERETSVENKVVDTAVPEKAPEAYRPEPAVEERREEQSREPVKQSSLAEAVKNASASNEGKTMSYFSAASSAAAQSGSPRQHSEPVVGWLVCIKGPHFGECFSIFAGKNSIGRSGENRIVIENDYGISRVKHALIVYEPKKRNFYLQPGDSSGLTYLNDEYITESRKLASHDTVELGDSTFLFVPLCGESFTWEDHMPKGE